MAWKAAACRWTTAGCSTAMACSRRWRATNGRVRRFQSHMARLTEGCHRLGMPAPPVDLHRNGLPARARRLRRRRGQAHADAGSGSARLSAAGRAEPDAHRRLDGAAGVRVRGSAAAHLRVCETRLGRNPRLAGIKHLNRLEQVLAGAELREPAVDEGLMRSTDDRIVCATAANVFLVRSGRAADAADQRLRRVRA